MAELCVSGALEVPRDIAGELNGVAVATVGADVVYTGKSEAFVGDFVESCGPNTEHPLINTTDVTIARDRITTVELMLDANSIALA